MTLFHLQLKNYFAGYKVFAWQFSPSFGTSNNVISWSQGIHSFCFFTLWPHHEACGILVPSAWVLSRFSCVWLCATLWAVAHQAPLSAGFSRQEYWSGMPYPSPGNLPKPVIKPRSPALQADSSDQGIKPGMLASPANKAISALAICLVFRAFSGEGPTESSSPRTLILVRGSGVSSLHSGLGLVGGTRMAGHLCL